MQKALLTLLSVVLASTAFVQEQFVITPAEGMKGALGRLNLKFPTDVTWELDVRTADDRFITHRSQNDTKAFFDLAPGTYIFSLSRVPVKGVVTIEKGKETRLKSGILNIVSNGNWSLYDETKKKFYSSSDQKKKFPIPAGNYILRLGGQDLPITIKDGETLEM